MRYEALATATPKKFIEFFRPFDFKLGTPLQPTCPSFLRTVSMFASKPEELEMFFDFSSFSQQSFAPVIVNTGAPGGATSSRQASDTTAVSGTAGAARQKDLTPQKE